MVDQAGADCGAYNADWEFRTYDVSPQEGQAMIKGFTSTKAGLKIRVSVMGRF
jgi:hypothetical protein